MLVVEVVPAQEAAGRWQGGQQRLHRAVESCRRSWATPRSRPCVWPPAHHAMSLPELPPRAPENNMQCGSLAVELLERSSRSHCLNAQILLLCCLGIANHQMCQRAVGFTRYQAQGCHVRWRWRTLSWETSATRGRCPIGLGTV